MGWGIVIVSALAAVRVAVLAGERVALRRLGAGGGGVATTLVACGGACLALTAAAWGTDSFTAVRVAFLPSLLYTLHFVLYTAAFAEGPVSAVSPWTNLTVLLLFLVHPRGGPLAWAGVSVLAFGAGLAIAESRGRPRPIVLIVAADVLLVVGRSLDATRLSVPPIGYAANLYAWVTLWLLIYASASGRLSDAYRLVARRPGWAAMASLANGASYVILVILLRILSLPAVEGLGAVAALAAGLAGAYWLNEPTTGRKMMASWLMSGGAVALICDHLGGFG
jgi:hypothetical protein